MWWSPCRCVCVCVCASLWFCAVAHQQLEKPFHFQHIRSLSHPDDIDSTRACVVIAAPGSLESGLSRRLFDRWCEGPQNGVVLTGLLPEGTPAREITRINDKLVMGMDGKPRRVNCQVEVISFAAHVDFSQNYEFIQRVRPANVVLVHGEQHAMLAMKKELTRRVAEWPEEEQPNIFNPANLEYTLTEAMLNDDSGVERRGIVSLRFGRRKKAKAVGKIAERSTTGLRAGDAMEGVLVSKDFDYRLMSAADVSTHTPIHVAGLHQKLHVPFCARIHVLEHVLRKMFAGVEVSYPGSEGNAEGERGPVTRISVSDRVVVVHDAAKNNGSGLVLEWDASPASDMVADAVVAACMHAQTSPSAVLMTTQLNRDDATAEQAKVACA